MVEFHVDPETCVRCGECAKECPWSIIIMPVDKDETPFLNEERAHLCIRCQHCLAVCPTGSLSVAGIRPEECEPMAEFPTGEAMDALVRGRRSIRQFKDEQVDKGLIARLLETANYSPTGKNNLSTLFTVVDDREVMDKLRQATMDGIRQAVENETLPPGMEFFQGVLGAWFKGRDVIFRFAPHFLATSSPKDSVCPAIDPIIAMSAFDLLAQSHGLGTLWVGFAKYALLEVAPEAGKLLNIPDDHQLGYMMVFGKPDVRYHRIVQRGPARINRMKL